MIEINLLDRRASALQGVHFFIRQWRSLLMGAMAVGVAIHLLLGIWLGWVMWQQTRFERWERGHALERQTVRESRQRLDAMHSMKRSVDRQRESWLAGAPLLAVLSERLVDGVWLTQVSVSRLESDDAILEMRGLALGVGAASAIEQVGRYVDQLRDDPVIRSHHIRVEMGPIKQEPTGLSGQPVGFVIRSVSAQESPRAYH